MRDPSIPLFLTAALALNPISAADELPGARSQRISLPRPQAFLASRADAARWPAATLLSLAPVDNAALARIAAARAEPGLPREIGIVRPLPGGIIDPATHGTWSIDPDGSAVWRLQLSSPGARAMRIHFGAFDLPDNSQLLVTSPTPGARVHDYKGAGPLNKGEFWSHTIYADTVLIEYRAKLGVTLAPILDITGVVHDFAGIQDNPQNERGFGGDVLPCQVDVSCTSVSDAARDAVGQMTYVEGVTHFVCSGSLLNDADETSETPWFLTAHHCIGSSQVASTLEVTWFFQTPGCDGVPPNPAFLPSSLGSDLIATSSATDFTFLELSEQPPDGVGYAGWSASAASGALFGVHHPAGSWKRYTRFSIVSSPSTCSSLPTTNFLYLNQLEGIIEGGSSGSPAFNASNQVVGQLYGTCGTTTNCAAPPKAVYGRFAVSYANHNLGQYLFTQVVSDDIYENNDSFGAAATINEGDYTLQLRDADDYYEITLAQPSRLSIDAQYTRSEMDLDLYLYESDTTLVDSSILVSGTESIVRALPAGTYVIRANRYSGNGGAYDLQINIDPGLESDLDNDGEVAVGDIALTLLGWGLACDTGPSEACPDLNADGFIDMTDLNTVLRDYGLMRAEFKASKWKKAMKTLYNAEIRPLFTSRTSREKKLDLKNLGNASP